MVWGCIGAYAMDSLHIWKEIIISAECIKVLDQHLLPPRQHLFHGRHCIFEKDDAKPHPSEQHGFAGEESGC